MRSGPDRFDRFGSGFGDQDDGAAFIAESLSELAGEIFFVRVGEQFIAIDEEQEGRWRGRGLGGVKELEEMAGAADGLSAFDSLLEGAVEQGGGDALLELSSDVADSLEQAVEVELTGGRGENDGSVIQEKEGVLHPPAKGFEIRVGCMPLAVGGAFGLLSSCVLEDRLKEIPFVHHQDAGLMRGGDEVGNLLVLLENAGFGVENQERDIRAGNGCFGASHAIELNTVMDASRFPDPGGVDEDVGLPMSLSVDLEWNVDGIPGGARDGADNHARRLGEGVDER